MIIACSPQKSEASEAFSNKHFLEFTDAKKVAWLHGAISALYHVAAAKSQEQGQCVYDWYFSDDRGKTNALIIASMEKYPDHTPVTVLLALTERECGAYRK